MALRNAWVDLLTTGGDNTGYPNFCVCMNSALVVPVLFLFIFMCMFSNV